MKIDTELSKQVFDTIRVYIYKISGINITEDKKYLIQQRLEPMLKAFGMSNFSELAFKLEYNPDSILRDNIIIAITTNETFFFRDVKPFDVFMEKIMPDLCKLVIERKTKMYSRRGPKVSIWSAASSTGQEPYTIGMVISEYLTKKGITDVSLDDFSIFASDIDSSVLAKAISGEYSQSEISRGLSDYYRLKYFVKMGDSKWVIMPEIKKIIDFKQVNLIENLSNLGSFDVVFCRNVLIYFDLITKKKIIQDIYNLLTENGKLILGSSESIYEISSLFESEHIDGTILYKKKR